MAHRPNSTNKPAPQIMMADSHKKQVKENYLIDPFIGEQTSDKKDYAKRVADCCDFIFEDKNDFFKLNPTRAEISISKIINASKKFNVNHKIVASIVNKKR